MRHDCAGHSRVHNFGQPAREHHAKTELPRRTTTAANSAAERPRNRERQSGDSVELFGGRRAPILALPDVRHRSRKRTFVKDRQLLPASLTTTE